MTLPGPPSARPKAEPLPKRWIRRSHAFFQPAGQNHKPLPLEIIDQALLDLRIDDRRGTLMRGTMLRKWITIASAACALGVAVPVVQAATAERDIAIDVQGATTPLDRFFNLSVGSDYPGT